MLWWAKVSKLQVPVLKAYGRATSSTNSSLLVLFWTFLHTKVVKHFCCDIYVSMRICNGNSQWRHRTEWKYHIYNITVDVYCFLGGKWYLMKQRIDMQLVGSSYSFFIFWSKFIAENKTRETNDCEMVHMKYSPK